MAYHFLGIMLIISALVFGFPAIASEDSDDPFPDGISFDDLPDISSDDLEPLDSSAEGQESSASTSAAAELSDQETPKEDEKKTNPPTLLPETRYKPATGQVFSSNKNISQPSETSIFLPQRPEIHTDTPSIDKDKTLTETLKESPDTEHKGLLEGTWVEKLATSNPLSLLASERENRQTEDKLENLVKDARGKGKDERGKSNASVFDISGVMLRMSLDQTTRTLENRGFKKINAKFQIPNFIKWRNEEACRNEGIVGYERIEACVITRAQKAGYQYLQYLKYAKFDSKEEIEVYFTSTFTENKVYKIVYRSTIASITGNSPKAVYIRNIKVYDFWKKISQKYGHPDNKTTVTWGMGGNKPYLKAATGFLILEDPMFREMDYTRMSREDQRFIHSDFYNF